MNAVLTEIRGFRLTMSPFVYLGDTPITGQNRPCRNISCFPPRRALHRPEIKWLLIEASTTLTPPRPQKRWQCRPAATGRSCLPDTGHGRTSMPMHEELNVYSMS